MSKGVMVPNWPGAHYVAEACPELLSPLASPPKDNTTLGCQHRNFEGHKHLEHVIVYSAANDNDIK